MENNKVYIIQNLAGYLTIEIKKNVANMKLQKRLNELFVEKGLSANIVYEIFSDTLDVENLDNIETIALATILYEETNNEDINPSNYFSDLEIQSYDTYIARDYDKMDILELENVTKINDYEYSFLASWELLSKIRKNKLYVWNKEIQRGSKYVTLPNGDVVEKENVNMEGVADLKQRFIAKDIKVTTITFALLLEEGKKAKYKFEEYTNKQGMKVSEVEKKKQFGTVGKMFIKPDFDKKSSSYAPFIISDGNHRLTGGCDAYDEKQAHGQTLEGGLLVTIHIGTAVEEKKYIDDVFKRSDTDIEWRESIVETDSSKCVSKLVEKIKLFKENPPASIFEQMNINKSLTYTNILRKAIEETNIDLNDQVDIKFATDKMANVINELISYLLNKSNMFTTQKHMKESSYLLDSGMFIGYIAIAYKLKDTWNVDKMIIIADKLLNLNHNSIIKKLKLDQKNINAKQVYDFFSNLSEEVM